MNITSTWSEVAIGNYNLFKDIGIEIPMIGTINSSPFLTDSSVFPLFTRLIENSYSVDS